MAHTIRMEWYFILSAVIKYNIAVFVSLLMQRGNFFVKAAIEFLCYLSAFLSEWVHSASPPYRCHTKSTVHQELKWNNFRAKLWGDILFIASLEINRRWERLLHIYEVVDGVEKLKWNTCWWFPTPAPSQLFDFFIYSTHIMCRLLNGWKPLGQLVFWKQLF